MKLEQAYPAISFRWRTRNWWARLTRTAPECIHLENDVSWMATFIPDTLYLSGKAAALRKPARPEICVCRTCLLSALEAELSSYSGRVVAFEPDGDSFSQYFFVAQTDFAAAGVEPTTAAAISRRIEQPWGNASAAPRPEKTPEPTAALPTGCGFRAPRSTASTKPAGSAWPAANPSAQNTARRNCAKR